jgi:hypothetical protein
LEQHTKNNIINDHKINANGQKDPPKIYPIWYFWYENKSSGNPFSKRFAAASSKWVLRTQKS